MSLLSRCWSLTLALIVAVILPLATGANRGAHASSPIPRATPGWQAGATISATGGTIFDATFLDAANGWAVGSGGGLYHTVDGGSTWATVVTGITNDLDQVVFADPQDGYVRGNNIILQTTNGGVSWQQLPTTFPNTMASLSAPSPSMLAVYATPNNAPDGVYISTNSGISWTLSLTATNINQVLFTSPLDGWVVGANAVLRTVDGGASWQTVFDASGPGGTSNNYLQIYWLDAANGFMLAFPGGGPSPEILVLRTTDGGHAWTPTGSMTLPEGDTTLPYVRMAFASPTMGLVGNMSLDYLGTQLCQHGLGFFLFETTDGTTWQPQPWPGAGCVTIPGFRGTAPYFVLDNTFYYYGYPATPTPQPTSTATNTTTTTPTSMPTTTLAPTATPRPTLTQTAGTVALPTATSTPAPTEGVATPIPTEMPPPSATEAPPTTTSEKVPVSSLRTTIPLAVAVQHTVASGGYLAFRVKTAPHGHTSITIAVTTTRVVTVGKGKAKRRVRRTVVLYRVSERGTADHLGRLNLRVHLTYRPNHAMRAGVSVVVQSGRLTRRWSTTTTIRPPGHSG
jgi:photosystem II stability/assembly factor-like uncharacterized protein